ncbi:hypothetical protein PM082_022421 [Marasmius tenuissimus]|nr:hypothetical protein PM082_022421 [Marasmius tenuissimus]
MIYDTVMLIMILIPGVAAFRFCKSSRLMKTIYEDGALYHGFIFLLSVVNVFVILTLPFNMIHLFATFATREAQTAVPKACYEFLPIMPISSSAFFGDSECRCATRYGNWEASRRSLRNCRPGP